MHSLALWGTTRTNPWMDAFSCSQLIVHGAISTNTTKFFMSSQNSWTWACCQDRKRTQSLEEERMKVPWPRIIIGGCQKQTFTPRLYFKATFLWLVVLHDFQSDMQISTWMADVELDIWTLFSAIMSVPHWEMTFQRTQKQVLVFRPYPLQASSVSSPCCYVRELKLYGQRTNVWLVLLLLMNAFPVLQSVNTKYVLEISLNCICTNSSQRLVTGNTCAQIGLIVFCTKGLRFTVWNFLKAS